MTDYEVMQAKIKALRGKFNSKVAFAPPGSMPPPDPSMMAAGGAPAPAPMDPAAMGGGMPMDPAAMGGAPPMDPAAMGGMPPMDPAMAGGAPPMDPAMMGGGMPPVDPTQMGAMPPQQQDPMQMMMEMQGMIEAIGDILMKVCRHFNISLDGEDKGAEALATPEDAAAAKEQESEKEELEDPLSAEAAEAVNQPGESNFVQDQLNALGGGM